MQESHARFVQVPYSVYSVVTPYYHIVHVTMDLKNSGRQIIDPFYAYDGWERFLGWFPGWILAASDDSVGLNVLIMRIKVSIQV